MPVVDYGHDYAQWYSGCWVQHGDEVRRVAAIVNQNGESYRESRITDERRVRFALEGGDTVKPEDVVYTMPEVLGVRRCANTNAILIASRVGARQWKRGVHHRTVNVRTPSGLRRVTGAVPGSRERNLARIASRLFTPTFDTLADVRRRNASVLSDMVWVYNYHGTRLVGYGDHIVGTLGDHGPELYQQARHLVQVMEDVFTTMEVTLK